MLCPSLMRLSTPTRGGCCNADTSEEADTVDTAAMQGPSSQNR